MKKITISVLVVALCYIATVFYIGNKTETVFQDYIANSDKSSKELYDVSVKLVSYKKSFLSSSAEVEIDVINPPLRADLVEFINLPIKSNFIVNHGPIFFHDQLTFGLAKVDSNIIASEVIANAYLEEFNNYVSGDVVISTSIDFNLSGKIKAKSIIDGIDITSESKNERLAFTPIAIIIETDSNKVDSYKSSLQFKDFTINSDDFYVNVSGVRVDSNIQRMFGGIVPIGVNKGSIDDIMIRSSGLGLQPINLSIKSNTSTSESSSKLLAEGSVNLTLKNSDKFSIPIPVDSINAKVKLFGLSENDISSLNNILSISPSSNEDILLGQLELWANNLLSGGDLNYDLGVSATKDSNFVVNAGIRLGYKGHKFAKSSLEETLLSLQKNVLDIVNAELEILVNKSLIKSLNKNEAVTVEMMLSGLINEGLVEENSTEYIVSASYKDRVAMVNKKDLSKDLLRELVNLKLIDSP